MGQVIRDNHKKFDLTIPVLVVGAGACGCTAALAVNDAGIEVMILERDSKPRGNTSLSGGQIPAAGTKLQKKAGINDEPDILAADIIAKAKGQCDKQVARHVAYESAKTVDWLVDNFNLPLSCINDFLYPGHSRPHMHASPSRFGAELLTVFLQAVENQGIDVALNAPVTDLFVDDNHRIRGVRISRPDGKTEDVGCDTLILACNGYGANKDLLRRFIPEIVDTHYHGHDGNQGDAIIWGEALGASIKDMGSFQGHGAVTTPHAIHLGWPVITEGGIQVNIEGERFSNENHGYSEQAMNVVRQRDGVAWTIWDKRCEEVASQMHSHQEALKAGAIKKFDNINDLVSVIGCKSNTLQETLDSVEKTVLSETVDSFGRDFFGKPPLQPPYYIAKIMAALFHTQGGLEVDTTARVIMKDGSAFPNLFAGGGAARGLSGPADWGYLSGSGLMFATTMGRLAGESAVKLLAQSSHYID